MTIQLAREAQMALLLAEIVTVPAEYLYFTNLFSKKLANVLTEQNGVNKHGIELEKSK